MFLVTSKDPIGFVRRAVAPTLGMATQIANRMRTSNPDGVVVVERPDGGAIVYGSLSSGAFGPAGFVSADDGEVIEFSQEGYTQKPLHRAVAELGGRDCGDADHMVTETLIRGMYAYWRRVMEV